MDFLKICLLICTSFNYKKTMSTRILENSTYLDSCLFGDQPVWNMYKWYFNDVRLTTFIVLYNKRHDYFYKDYIDAFLKQYHELGASLKIIWLSQIIEFHRSKRQTVQITAEENRHREYVSQSNSAYILLTWSEQQLQYFLTEQANNVILNPRALHLIIFIAGWDDRRCDDWNKDIARLLERFWRRFGIVSMVAKVPCSCHRDLFHVYDPFYRNVSVWGQVQQFTDEQFFRKPFEFMRTLNDLNGYPLRISMFPRNPTAVIFDELPHPLIDIYKHRAVYEDNLYGGLDGSLLNALAEYMNFSPIVRTADDNIEYGYRNENGSFTGTLGDIVYRKSEISFNARFIKGYNTDDIEFTYPVSNEEFCLITPKALQVPQFMMIFQCFSLYSWIAIFTLLLLGTSLWSFIKNLDCHNENIQVGFERTSDILLLFLSAPIKLPFSVSHRLFIAVYLIANLIFVGIFQSSLVTSFTTKSFFKDINTLEAFDKSGLRIGTTSRGLEDIFESNDNASVTSKLKKKIVILPYEAISTIDRAALRRDIAAVERKADARLIILTDYIGPDGVPLLHIVDKCPATYFLSYVMPKGSPFLLKFDDAIRRFSEAGLLEKWYEEMTSALIYEAAVKFETDAEKKPFSLEDMQSAFYILIIGLSLAIFVFFSELCVEKWRRFDIKEMRFLICGESFVASN